MKDIIDFDPNELSDMAMLAPYNSRKHELYILKLLKKQREHTLKQIFKQIDKQEFYKLFDKMMDKHSQFAMGVCFARICNSIDSWEDKFEVIPEIRRLRQQILQTLACDQPQWFRDKIMNPSNKQLLEEFREVRKEFVEWMLGDSENGQF